MSKTTVSPGSIVEPRGQGVVPLVVNLLGIELVRGRHDQAISFQTTIPVPERQAMAGM